MLEESGCKLAVTVDNGVANIFENNRLAMPHKDVNEIINIFNK